jgi:hypothetical protein
MWEMNHDYLSKFLENCAIIVTCADIIIIFFVNWWLFIIQKRFIILLDLVKEVDEGLLQLGCTVNHVYHKKVVIIILVVMKALNVVGNFLAFIGGQISDMFKGSAMMSIADYLWFESFAMLYLQFIFFIWLVKIRFQHINKLLKRIMKKDSNERIGLIEKTLCEDLKTIAILHNKLVDIVEYSSFCYGVPVSSTFNVFKKMLNFKFTDNVDDGNIFCFYHFADLHWIPDALIKL